MSVAENKDVVRSWIEGVNSPNWEQKLRPFFTSESDWEAWRTQHIAFRRAFPDYQARLDGLIGEGDVVTAWTTVSGTFSAAYDEGGLEDIEPRGQKATWHEVSVVDFSGAEPDIKLFLVDEAGRARQLGAQA